MGLVRGADPRAVTNPSITNFTVSLPNMWFLCICGSVSTDCIVFYCVVFIEKNSGISGPVQYKLMLCVDCIYNKVFKLLTQVMRRLSGCIPACTNGTSASRRALSERPHLTKPNINQNIKITSFFYTLQYQKRHLLV